MRRGRKPYKLSMGCRDSHRRNVTCQNNQREQYYSITTVMFNDQPPGIYLPMYRNGNNATDMVGEQIPVKGKDIEAVQDHLDALCDTETHMVNKFRIIGTGRST